MAARSESPLSRVAATAVRRTAFVPALCPAAIGSPRLRAQRAFPSMMIATACATSGSSGSAAGRTCRSVLIFVRMLTAVAEALDLHNFSFFVLEQVVDRLRVLVGQLLHAFLRAVLVVLADFALGQVL